MYLVSLQLQLNYVPSNLKPFQPVVWLTLTGVVALMTVVFVLVNRYSPAGLPPTDCHQDCDVSLTDCIHTKRDSAWVFLSSYMEQGE